MKTIRWMVVLTLALPVLARAADEPSRTPQAPPLLSHDELQKRLNDSHLRLLDARSRANYEKGHIPGALWVDVKELQALTRPETLSDKDAWARALAPLAIDETSEVYVYDDDRQHNAGRVWWQLSYAGVPRVGLIDGGFPLWERERRPVNSETVQVEPRTFAVNFHAKRAASRDEVRSAIQDDKVQIVDARSAAEYRGEKKPQDGGLRRAYPDGPLARPVRPGRRRRPVPGRRRPARTVGQGRHRARPANHRLFARRQPLGRGHLRAAAAGHPGPALHRGAERLGERPVRAGGGGAESGRRAE